MRFIREPSILHASHKIRSLGGELPLDSTHYQAWSAWASVFHRSDKAVGIDIDADTHGSWPFQLFQPGARNILRSEEHTSELQSRPHLVCRLLLEKKKKHKDHN